MFKAAFIVIGICTLLHLAKPVHIVSAYNAKLVQAEKI